MSIEDKCFDLVNFDIIETIDLETEPKESNKEVSIEFLEDPEFDENLPICEEDDNDFSDSSGSVPDNYILKGSTGCIGPIGCIGSIGCTGSTSNFGSTGCTGSTGPAYSMSYYDVIGPTGPTGSIGYNTYPSYYSYGSSSTSTYGSTGSIEAFNGNNTQTLTITNSSNNLIGTTINDTLTVSTANTIYPTYLTGAVTMPNAYSFSSTDNIIIANGNPTITSGSANSSWPYTTNGNLSTNTIIGTGTEPPKATNKYIYNRLSHFKSYLKQFSIKPAIPDDIYETIITECQNLKKNQKKNSRILVLSVLDSLELNLYKRYSYYIADKLDGNEPQLVDEETVNKMIDMFGKIEKIYSKYSTGINFFSSTYLIGKLLEILDKKQFIKYYDLTCIKSTNIIKKHDEVFKKICEELNWQFIPSI